MYILKNQEISNIEPENGKKIVFHWINGWKVDFLKKSSTSGDGIIHKIKIMLQILMTREIV